MGYRSEIEWTDHTFNPWWGCTRVSPACDNCYAEAFSRRLGMNIWSYRTSRRFLSDTNWRLPLKWNEHAAKAGRKERVFCASMADVFEWKRGLSHERDKLWKLIESTPYLIWLLLTKRPHLVKRLVPWEEWPSNVWIGTTVEDQKWTDKRIPSLVDLPTENRFLSCEPLLGQIDIAKWLSSSEIGWVIAGGESGHHARPTEPDWFYHLRDQCLKFNTPFHFKQWGNWAPIDSAEKQIPRRTFMQGFSTPLGRYPRKISGRMLQGREWNEFPAGFAA